MKLQFSIDSTPPAPPPAPPPMAPAPAPRRVDADRPSSAVVYLVILGGLALAALITAVQYT